jgi:hypothetical protein
MTKRAPFHMQLDKSFCSGLRCDRKKECERWTGNLHIWQEATGREVHQISMAQFADHEGKCTRFIALERYGPAGKCP